MFYEYICKGCRYEKEVTHSILEDPVIKCDKCQEIMKRKITLNGGIHFKGSGFTKRSVN